jgi:hypothetical protein
MLYSIVVGAEALARMIRRIFEKGERAVEQQFLRLRPQRAGPIDARLTLGAKTVLGLRHRGWKDGEQDVAIVRFAQRILQEREGLRRRFQRRLEFAKALQRIAKALARDAKIVKRQSFALLQAAGKPPNLAQASM